MSVKSYYFTDSSYDQFKSACSDVSISYHPDGPSLDVKLRSIFPRKSNFFNQVHVNEQSIPAHIFELSMEFNNGIVDGTLISESWLKLSLPSRLFTVYTHWYKRNVLLIKLYD